MSLTGGTAIVTLIDSVSRSPVSGVTCILYNYGVTVVGDVISGAIATPLSGASGSTVVAVSNRYGNATFTNIAPGRYSLVITGAGIRPQIPPEYAYIEICSIIRGAPDYLQLYDPTGGTRWVYVSTGGTVTVSGSTPSATVFTGSYLAIGPEFQGPGCLWSIQTRANGIYVKDGPSGYVHTPNHPRVLTFHNYDDTSGGTVTFEGYDQDGVAVTDTLIIPAGTGYNQEATGSVAFSVITQFTVDFVEGTAKLCSVGPADIFGLPTRPGGTLVSVFKQMRMTAYVLTGTTAVSYVNESLDIPIGVVDYTFRTVALTTIRTEVTSKYSFGWYYTYS